jgi:hypothetical protein
MSANHRFPQLRYLAWISAGIVLVMLLMNTSVLLVAKGTLGNGVPVAVFTLIAAAVLGILLAGKATTRHAAVLSLSIAFYRPVLYLLMWPLALLQDLWVSGTIPGDSLKALTAVTPQSAPLIVVALAALVMFLSSRLFRKLFPSANS